MCTFVANLPHPIATEMAKQLVTLSPGLRVNTLYWLTQTPSLTAMS